MGDAQKSYLKSDDKRKVDLGVFQEYEDRVQRLSGEHLQEKDDDEDLLSEERQDAKIEGAREMDLGIGLVRCSFLSAEGGELVRSDSTKVLNEAYKDSKVLNEEEEIHEVASGALLKKENQEICVTDKQRMVETRQSNRVQGQLLRKYQKHDEECGKKRTLEGMSSNLENYFSVLHDDEIVNLANNMGVKIPEEGFDVINIMRDLECARQALNKVKNRKEPEICEGTSSEVGNDNSDIPLLEWIEADSKIE
jgi:hypothetical protein